MDKGREIICLRICDSDERGFFFSLPGAELYSFLDGKGQLDLIYEGYNPCIPNSLIYFYSHIDGTIMHFVENGEYKVNLSLKASLYTDENVHYVFVLNVTQNTLNATTEFYDGFYDTRFSINDYDLPEGAVFAPFAFRGITGNVIDYKSPKLKVDEIEIIIDEYTDKITSVVTPYDIMYDDRNGIRIKTTVDFNSVFKDMKTFEELPFKPYYYKNEEVCILNDTPQNKQEVEKVKDLISQLRTLQSQITKKQIYNYLFEDFYGYLDVQESVKKAKSEIEILNQQSKEIQNKSSSFKEEKYANKLENYYKNNNCKYYVSMCLLIKNENQYLEEWLENYSKIGVEHFYIYDNGSTPSIQSTINNIQNGYYKDKCTIIDFSGKYKHMQYECYNDCLKKYGKDNFWIGFVDTDELVQMREGLTLKDFLSKFEHRAQVWIPWKVFNSNGHIRKPKGKMVENFTKTVQNPSGLYGKMFVQPYRIKRMYVHLALGYNPKCDMAVNSTGEWHCLSFEKNLVRYFDNDETLYEDIWIGHYVTRSFEEWMEKIKRGSCDPNFRRKFDLYFQYNPELEFLKKDPKVLAMLDEIQPYEK